jgi:hypothetical protein
MKAKKDTVKNISATLKWESDFKDTKESETKILDIRIFPEGVVPGFINYSRGETISLGNYESTKLSLSVTMPCLKEELIAAMKYVTTYVENELDKRVADIEEKYGIQNAE